MKRGQRGRFEKGTKPGPGRPKGLLNKFTGDLKEVFLQAAQAAGGVSGAGGSSGSSQVQGCVRWCSGGTK